MDIISQLQDQVDKIAYLVFNTVGTLQRDAPSSRLSQQYPAPPSSEAHAAVAQQPKAMAEELLQAAKEVLGCFACLFADVFVFQRIITLASVEGHKWYLPLKCTAKRNRDLVVTISFTSFEEITDVRENFCSSSLSKNNCNGILTI
jgi:hypothetical protein